MADSINKTASGMNLPEEPQNKPETQSLNKRKQQSVFSSNNLRVTKKPKLQRILTSTASSVVVKIEPAEVC